jgi:hypothetical protein
MSGDGNVLSGASEPQALALEIGTIEQFASSGRLSAAMQRSVNLREYLAFFNTIAKKS